MKNVANSQMELPGNPDFGPGIRNVRFKNIFWLKSVHEVIGTARSYFDSSFPQGRVLPGHHFFNFSAQKRRST